MYESYHIYLYQYLIVAPVMVYIFTCLRFPDSIQAILLGIPMCNGQGFLCSCQEHRFRDFQRGARTFFPLRLSFRDCTGRSKAVIPYWWLRPIQYGIDCHIYLLRILRGQLKLEPRQASSPKRCRTPPPNRCPTPLNRCPTPPNRCPVPSRIN